MSNRYDDLILHLKLDDIDSTNTTPDSSKSGLKAKVNGASLVKDDTFGACLNFQGQADHVEVSSVDLAGENPPHTIEGWIKVEAYPQTARSWILLLGQADEHSHHWLLNTETAGVLCKKAQLGQWGQDIRYQAKPIIPLAEWVHLATTFDGLNYICYVNGEAIDKQEHYKFTLTDKRLTLGKTGIATDKNFQGKMAHVRIYRRALSQAEIREDKNADKDDLVLHLNLDDIDISTNKTPDSSKSGLKATVHGASLVADDTFGACLHFDEPDDYVEVPDLRLPGQNPAHTIESWIKVETYPQATSWMMLLGQNGPADHYWLLAAENVVVGTSVMSKVPLREWVHIATSYDGHVLVGYLNGKPVHGPITGTFNLTDKRLTLAKRAIATEKNFQGKMAHVRVYRRALSEAEIREDMDTDRLALSEYRRGHPIGFSLSDKDENYVLYIGDDPRDHHHLNLELRNTSSEAIRFQKQGDTASKANHHFELVFRNGVLSDKTLQMLRENKDNDKIVPEKDAGAWDVSVDEDNLSGTISVYFLYKDTSKPFDPRQRLIVPLRKISANAGAGARGTRVELKLKQLTYVGETTPITGSRIQHLQIISHLGSQRAPLHIGFVGSNRILNDGSSPNTLVLQLMNVLKSEGDTSVTLTKDSEFLISFDVQSSVEVAPWSLCTENEIEQLKASDTILVAKTDSSGKVSIGSDGKPDSDTGRWQVTRTDHGQGESPVWKIAPRQDIEDIVLKRDDYIFIYISNIKTSLPSGLTSLYLDYKRIPGFWDGQVVCPIEKAPLLFYDVRAKALTFWLSQRVMDYTKRWGYVFPNPNLSIQGRAGLLNFLADKRKELSGTQVAEIDAVVNEVTTLKEQLPPGEVRVGVGCVKPEAKLEIALSANDADTKPLVIRKDNVNYLTVLKDGNVGIGKGKEEPKASLDVSGEIRANYFRAGEGYSKRLPVGKRPVGTPRGTSLEMVWDEDIKWYRIAKIAAPEPMIAGAEFSLRAKVAGRTFGNVTFRIMSLSGLHPIAKKHAFARLTILSNNGQALSFSKVRIVVPSNVQDASEGYLEIFVRQSPDGETEVNFSIYDNLNNPAWQPIAWEEQPAALPDTLVAVEYSLEKSLFLVADATERFSVASNGDVLINSKVGIGKSSPQSQLHVGPGSTSITADRVNAVFSSETVDAGIAIAQRDGVNVLLQASGAGGYIGTESNHALVLRTSGADRVVVDAGGKVGIKSSLAVEGPISERMDLITTGSWKDPNNDQWSKHDSPIMKYFTDKLVGKPAGTTLRAIAEHETKVYWEGWIDAKGRTHLAIRGEGGS